MKIVWQNDTGEPIVMNLPDDSEVVLELEDPILLDTTRKFSTERLKKVHRSAQPDCHRLNGRGRKGEPDCHQRQLSPSG